MNTKEQLLRDHRLYHRWFRELSNGKILYNADKSLKTKKDITNNHAFLVDQMLKERIDHYLVDDLDEFLDDEVKKLCMVKDLLKLPREHVIVKDFVSLHDEGIALKTRILNDKGLIDVNHGLEMIKRILKMQDRPVEYSSLMDSDAVPLYDLILRRKITTLPQQQDTTIKAWIGDCTEKPDGFLGISNVFAENVDGLIDYSTDRIPFADNSASELVFNKVLTQTYSPSRWMHEAHRVLIDGGLLHFEDLSLKNSGSFAHPFDNSYINKEFFAFWTIKELLGNRPKFELVSISEDSFDDELKDLILISGTLKAVKGFGVIPLELLSSYTIANAEILEHDVIFGIYKLGLKDEKGNIVDIGPSHPTNLDLRVNDKVSVLIDGLFKEDDKLSAHQIVILEKNDKIENIDLVEQVLKDQEEEEEEECIKFKVIKQDKAIDEYHLVYGVVAEPDLEDSDGHWSSVDDIREDAHNFLAKRRNVKISHFLPSDSEVVESYMSPVDWTAPDGQEIKKDSWIAVLRVKESEVWNSIENGAIVGFSKGGLATRVL